MNYKELKSVFQKHEQSFPKHHLTAHIAFSSFGPNAKIYEGLSRIYEVSSDNKAFQPNKGGYSIFASCLDGTDPCVRLERYMAEEKGGEDGWIVEDCYIVGWLLSAFLTERPDQSRGLGEQKLFYSQAEVTDALVQDVCKKSELSYEAARAKLQAGNGDPLDKDTFITKKYACVSNDLGCCWEWDIRKVRIYGPINIVFENRLSALLDQAEGTQA